MRRQRKCIWRWPWRNGGSGELSFQAAEIGYLSMGQWRAQVRRAEKRINHLKYPVQTKNMSADMEEPPCSPILSPLWNKGLSHLSPWYWDDAIGIGLYARDSFVDPLLTRVLHRFNYANCPFFDGRWHRSESQRELEATDIGRIINDTTLVRCYR